MRELQMVFITNPEIKRWMQILNVIEREQRFTVVELAERLAISQRTLIKDIQSIKKHLGESATLFSDYRGYHFEERVRVEYLEKKEQLLEQEILFEIVGNIFYGEMMTIAELAHQYNYAESTLRRFLSKIQSLLRSYGLTLIFNPVSFQGEEANIRKFFFDFYYSGEQTPFTIRPPEGLHHAILKELSGKLGKYELGTGTTISAFYYHLYIMIVRVQQNQLVSLPSWLKKRNYQENDFQLLYSLQGVIKKEYGIYLTKEEFSWLHFRIITKRTIDRMDQEHFFTQRFNRWSSVIEPVVTDYLADPFFDRWDTNVLRTFMTSFFVSRLINESISPVLNKELVEVITTIKKNSAHRYLEHFRFFQKHAQLLNFSSDYFEDIVISFMVYMDLVFHQYQPVKHVLFLLEGDYLIVQAIRQQAQQQLGERHKLLFMPLQELTQERLDTEQVDLIVTNYRPYVFEYKLKADYVLMNIIPDVNDWARVKHRLNPLIDHLVFYPSEDVK
ncbi:helix-turn-helix domain-containing protein [Enterococcus mundtii]|uniref:helix-turn-helix domain-containing protein n=1 Tax=Enterococcus mundtii TaxID=53346 RepID=UPI001378DA10|nr:helix-turn-helix domain-containing protein [Enterococcus mundtii]NBA63741.1 HTH domain-containing protein [Enterococcus mundtii]